jgi:hypothetical protein
LIDNGVQVLSEADQVEARGSGQGFQQGVGRHEARTANGRQLTDRNSVPGHDE